VLKCYLQHVAFLISLRTCSPTCCLAKLQNTEETTKQNGTFQLRIARIGRIRHDFFYHELHELHELRRLIVLSSESVKVVLRCLSAGFAARRCHTLHRMSFASSSCSNCLYMMQQLLHDDKATRTLYRSTRHQHGKTRIARGIFHNGLHRFHGYNTILSTTNYTNYTN